MSIAVQAPAQDVRPLTYDDLRAISDDDGKRREVIAGELIVSPSPVVKHQRASRELFSDLDQFVRRGSLGEVFYAPLDVKLSEHDIVIPDIVFVSRTRAAIIGEQGIEGPPDLVVEVLSPSTRAHDLVKKAAVYATFGVREYWIVDPDAETIFVQELRDGRYVPVSQMQGRARSVVLPGFEVSVARFFAAINAGTED